MFENESEPRTQVRGAFDHRPTTRVAGSNSVGWTGRIARHPPDDSRSKSLGPARGMAASVGSHLFCGTGFQPVNGTRVPPVNLWHRFQTCELHERLACEWQRIPPLTFGWQGVSPVNV
jgi:hypothetical protein